jgi:hypothetical protein
MGFLSKTDDRRERFETLKQTVDLGIKHFRRTGAALEEIRDHELYKISYGTFEQCCQAEWKITVRHANNLIAAYQTAEQLGTAVPATVSERTLRPLTTLPLEERAEAWNEAQAEGATTDAVEKAVAKRKPRKRRPKALRPIRLRTAGGWVTIEPNKKFVSAEFTLEAAIQTLRNQQRDAA